MKRIIIVITCISILFCGCSKSDKTSTSKEPGVYEIYYVEHDEFDRHDSLDICPQGLGEAASFVEKDGLKSIRLVCDSITEEKEYSIVKTGYSEGKLINEKICDIDNNLDGYIIDTYKFSNVDNNSVALYKELSQDIEYDIFSDIEIDIDTVPLIYNSERDSIYFENIDFYDNVVKMWISVWDEENSEDKGEYIVKYDVIKQEVIEIIENSFKNEFINSSNKYSLCADISDLDNKKWCIVDNETYKINQYTPCSKSFLSDVEEEDPEGGGYCNRDVRLASKDGKYYLLDGYGIYSYDIEEKEITKICGFQLKDHYYSFSIRDFVVVTEKEFYCVIGPYSEVFEMQVLHIVLE